MNKIEQMHLDAINSEVHGGVDDYGEPYVADAHLAASKSAMVTEQIAIEFADWLWRNCDENYMSLHSWESIYKEFLKTKQ